MPPSTYIFGGDCLCVIIFSTPNLELLLSNLLHAFMASCDVTVTMWKRPTTLNNLCRKRGHPTSLVMDAGYIGQ
jgi:hypothetical protein